MAPNLRDELDSTPPKLALSYLPSKKTVEPESPWALTPPLHPMVSIPFEWEEVPGRPRPTNMSSPSKPKSARCLELPPNRISIEAKVTQMPSSPTTVLDGPRLVRSFSHRFCFEGPIQKPNLELGLDVKLNNKLDKDEERKQIGPWKRWASVNDTKWAQQHNKGNSGFWYCDDDDMNGSLEYDKNVEVKITRFRKGSRGSLYKLSRTSSRVIDNILECFKQIMVRQRKQEKKRNGEP